MKLSPKTFAILSVALLTPGIATTSMASNAAERGCLDAVQREYRDNKHLRVVDTNFSQAATEVIVDAGGVRWSCIVWSDGRVQKLQRVGGQSNPSYGHNYDNDRYDHSHGVTLYRDYDYRGSSEVISTDIRDMSSTRIGNDSVSSLRVPRGCHVVLFRDNNYRGASETLSYDQPNLGRTRVGNDSVSSMEVDCGGHISYSQASSRGLSHDAVVLFRDADYRGGGVSVYDDIPDMAHTQIGTDSLSSIEVPRGCWVTLYEHNNYRGRSTELDGNESNLRHTGVGNDTVSSIRVHCR